MLPCLDNELPLIAKTKEVSKKDLFYRQTSNQTWFIPLSMMVSPPLLKIKKKH
jgi:hypothetical protein